MQQRRLRPGDVLDDYCPRERRVTDHAIVAMIDETIQQTRCVSCDTEHEYKQAKMPPQRRKKVSAALFNQVLDGLHPPSRPAHPSDARPDIDPVVHVVPPPSPLPLPRQDVDDRSHGWRYASAVAAALPHPVPVAVPPADVMADDDDTTPADDEGPVRRLLIRAQLPRHEGQVPQQTRVLPEFTVRQPKTGRGNRPVGPQRSATAPRRGNGRPEVPGNGPTRFSGPRTGGQGQGRPGGDRQGGGWAGNRAERGRGGRGGKKR